jgi:hypothetical protein
MLLTAEVHELETAGAAASLSTTMKLPSVECGASDTIQEDLLIIIIVIIISDHPIVPATDDAVDDGSDDEDSD